MSDTVDIGAARVRLIVDAADFEPVIEQGKRAITGFGSTAQQAYDKTEAGTRRAANALLDYVNSLGRADTTMDRYIRNASRMGVEKPVLDAAIQAWQKYTNEIEIAAASKSDDEAATKRAAAAYKELISTQQQAENQARALANAQAQQRAENLAQAQAATSQRAFNTQLGVKEAGPDFEARAHYAKIFSAQLDEIEAKERAEAQAAKEAAAAASQLATAQQAFIKQLQNTEQAAGKTYYELLQLKAAELGISQQADPMIAKLKATNQALGAGTISAKQYEFALRGLPAQFTDIFVSLAAGQNPLTVILQQGGQIKDMFGGIKTAVVVVAKEIGKLATNPWVLMATAVASFAVAVYQASTRVEELAIATAKGDQVAGNAKGLGEFSENLNKLADINLSSADAAVSSLAEAGLLVGKNFQLAAEAAARWASITGESADSVTKKFDQIARDPMQAILDGTLKVTDAQYQQLAALERVGDKQAEVALAVKLYYDQINNNSASVKENLSAMSLAWRDVKDEITGAWHELGTFAEKHQETIAKAIRVATEGTPLLLPINYFAGKVEENAGKKSAAQSGIDIGGGVANAVGDVSFETAATTKLTRDQVQANSELQHSWDQLGTKAERYASAVTILNAKLKQASEGALAAKNIQRNGDTFSGPGYQKLLQGERLKIFGEDQGPEPTKAIKAWEKAALDAIKNVQQQTDYMYADRQLLAETYHDKSVALIADEKNVQLASIDLQIKALTGRKHSEDAIAALTQQRATIESDYANKKAKLDREEVVAVRARAAAIRDYIDALKDANTQLERQGQQAVRGVGIGSAEAGLQNAKDNAVYAAQQRILAINKQVADGTLDAAAADREKTASTQALSDQLNILQSNFDDLKAAEADYLNGSRKAWADWARDVQNNAQFTGKLITDGLNGLASSFADFATTQKNTFGSLFASLSRMIIEFGAKQLLLAGLTGAKGGGGFGGALSGIMGLFGGGSAGTVAASSNAGSVGELGKLLGSVGSLFATGGAFPTGTLSGYRNSVVSSPTVFPFGKGGVPNVGLMGEKAGSPGEAIMPLTRTAGGDLGVKVTGQSGRNNVNIQQTFVVPGAATKSTQDQIATKTYGAATRAVRRS